MQKIFFHKTHNFVLIKEGFRGFFCLFCISRFKVNTFHTFSSAIMLSYSRIRSYRFS